MKLENQLSNKELSKRLCELGAPQESLFSYMKKKWTRDEDYRIALNGSYEFEMYEVESWEVSCSAFTVAELGEMLKTFHSDLDNKKYDWSAGQVKFGKSIWKTWIAGFKNEMFEADTEADARAKMLIYLLENKLI